MWRAFTGCQQSEAFYELIVLISLISTVDFSALKMNTFSSILIRSLFVALCAWPANGANFTSSTILIGGPTPTTLLNITCTPNIPGMTAVFSIDIGRMTRAGTKNAIIQITNTDPARIIDTSYTSRISTSGSLSESTGSLMMSLRDLISDDAASYYCKALVNTVSGPASDNGELNITVQNYGANLQPTTPTIIIGGQNPTPLLNITCTPNVPWMTTVFSIDIGRLAKAGSYSPIIQITNIDPVTIKDTSYTSRISVSGSISGSTGSLMMSLRNLRCDDAGSYYCKALVNTVSGPASDNRELNITVQANPGTIVMTPTPRKGSLYDVGETVTFSCFGPIGNREGSMESFWNWHTRDTAGVNPSWTTYPNTHNNITYQPKQSSGNCQYTARSVLTHVVKTTDNGRQFRCFFYNEIYQDNFTIYTENQNPSNPGNPGGFIDPAGA